MAPKQSCAKYQYVVTAAGPKILPVEEPSCKDEESPADYNAGGYLPVKVGDTFKHARYRVIRKLGWGHFSTVWLVKDAQTDQHSALKVVKSAGRYAETARDEIKLLSQVSSFAPAHPGKQHIVSFLDSFSHQGPEASHVCIVFEPLGENLLALIERHKKKGVPRALVKVIAKQVFLGLQYLHDECDLVHTDIKPENILISIPDIEAHIHNELSLSPSPTSRRVGVPLPSKSRAGVFIQHNQLRTRRQVQIFDSQPLASPGRSTGPGGHGHTTSMSISGRPGGSGSGSNSTNGSYIAQMHLARLSAVGVMPISGTAASLSSSAPKASSGLPASTLRTQHNPPPAQSHGKNPVVAQHHLNGTSPSTSSSSSSISSTLASTTAGSSSIVSTPPTSLSHSLGNVVAGFMGISKSRNEPKGRSPPSFAEGRGPERSGLPMFGKKGKERMVLENDLETALSTSLKDNVSSSWKDRISSSFSSPHLSSSYKSTTSSHGKSKLSQTHRPHAHSRSQSGFWKDPGAAAPAPAVVVSAVVNADGEGGSGDYFQLTSTGPSSSRVVGTSSTASESSSATVTVAHPSPDGTPHPSSSSGLSKAKSTSILNGVNKIITNTTKLLADATASHEPEPRTTSSCTSDPTPVPTNHHPSLLTQTAPPRAPVPPPNNTPVRLDSRPSPPQHVSQLSAHMHSGPPPLSCILCHPGAGMAKNTSLSNPAQEALTRQCRPARVSPTLDAPTPISPPLAAPPPTPIASPSISPFVSAIISEHTHNSSSQPIRSPTQPTTPDVSQPPPISIKIADLGNATPSTKHYTEDIQTRQYRAPEAILGKRDWDTRADIWSVACVIFELLTAEYLFDPQGQGELFTKDDDHMAQVIELLGDFSMEIKMGGKYSRELFDHTGALRYIRTLKPWPLQRVMTEKYLFTETEAAALCQFLLPMLSIDMRKRAHARDMLGHPWLEPTEEDAMVDEW